MKDHNRRSDTYVDLHHLWASKGRAQLILLRLVLTSLRVREIAIPYYNRNTRSQQKQQSRNRGKRNQIMIYFLDLDDIFCLKYPNKWCTTSCRICMVETPATQDEWAKRTKRVCGNGDSFTVGIFDPNDVTVWIPCDASITTLEDVPSDIMVWIPHDVTYSTLGE